VKNHQSEMRGAGQNCRAAVAVPGEIVVLLVAKLSVYGFWPRRGRFAELLRILESGLVSLLREWRGAHCGRSESDGDGKMRPRMGPVYRLAETFRGQVPAGVDSGGMQAADG
jgi:hypothetical protein